MTRLRYLKLCEIDYNSTTGYSFTNLWTLTQLRGLSLSSIVLTQNHVETGLSKLTNLEELDIYASYTHNESWFVDYTELLNLRRLTNLSVMDVKLNTKLANIIATMTQLIQLDFFELDGRYELGIYSNLTNLTRIWFGLDICYEDYGLAFHRMPKLEFVSIPWCQNVTQLVKLPKLRQLFLRKGNESEFNHLNFLKELTTLEELTISGDVLPFQGYVDLQGLTALQQIGLFMTSQSLNNKSSNALKRKLRSYYSKFVFIAKKKLSKIIFILLD